MAFPEQHLPEGTDSIIEGAGASTDPDEFDVEEGEAEMPALKTSATQTRGLVTQARDAASTTGETLSSRIDGLRGQAGDRARDFVEQGRDRAAAALDDVVKLMEDAAAEIDGRIGAQYGDYARRAAQGIGDFSQSVKGKDVDQLFADGRALVKTSPGIAIGTAAALGFVVARLVRAGLPGDAPGGKTAG